MRRWRRLTQHEIDEIARRLEEPGGTIIRPLADLEADVSAPLGGESEGIKSLDELEAAISPPPVRTDENDHLDMLEMGIARRP